MEISYDASKHYLGSLCKRGHAWNGLPHSLYRLSDKKCCECERLRNQRYRSSADYKAAAAEKYLLNKQDEHWVEKRREYQRQRVARIRAEQGREYRGRLPELQGVILPAGVGKGATMLLANRGILRPDMSLEQITILAEQTRHLESVLKNVGRTPTVVQLVEQEQRRYWSENPGTRREHTRQFYTDLSWLNYQLSPSIRRRHAEKRRRYRLSRDETARLNRFLQRAHTNPSRLPSVVSLIEKEQHRYWQQHPWLVSEHTRKFYDDLRWLNKQLFWGSNWSRQGAKDRREARMRRNVLAKPSPSQVKSRFSFFDGCCAYCGSGGKMQVEHFIPLARGGTHVLSNILPSCASCNSDKRDLDAEQWYRAQPFFTEQRWRRIRSVLGLTATTGQLSFL